MRRARWSKRAFFPVSLRRARSLRALLRDIENVQRVIQDRVGLVLQKPFVGVCGGQELAGEMRNAHHDRATGVIERAEFGVADPVDGWIDVSEICEMDDLAGMRILIFFEGDETLSPIGIAIREQTI